MTKRNSFPTARAMGFLACLASMLLIDCGGEKEGKPTFSRQPLSVRGWIEDFTPDPASYRRRDPATAEDYYRKLTELRQTTMSVEGTEYASGAVGENGAFLLLDVPPGDVTILFNSPNAPAAKLVLRGVPGNADVMIPGLLLTPTSTAILKPDLLRVRVPGDSKTAAIRKTGAVVTIAGHNVDVVEVPLGQLSDRREYPQPPATGVPILLR